MLALILATVYTFVSHPADPVVFRYVAVNDVQRGCPSQYHLEEKARYEDGYIVKCRRNASLRRPPSARHRK